MADQSWAPARETPYELVFGAETFEETLFPGIRDEIEERGAHAFDPERFAFLASVGRLLRMIAGEAAMPAPGGDPAVREYGHLLFQAYNFWRHGRCLFLLEPEGLSGLLDGVVPTGSELRVPHPAGYLQLPRHHVWARASAGMQAEAVDGVFWSASEDAGGGGTRLDLLLVLGMRPDRAGFSVVPAGATLDGGRVGDWAVDARPDGEDFASTLPGGELEDLVSLETQAEALKLMALWFGYLASHPESLGALTRNPPGAAPESRHALPPSSLEYRRVRGVAPDPARGGEGEGEGAGKGKGAGEGKDAGKGQGAGKGKGQGAGKG